METIAIIGKPGVGKTTISKYLNRFYDDINYLNIDEITKNDCKLLQLRKQGLKDIKGNILMGENEKKYYDGIKKIIINWIDEETKKGTKYGIVDFATIHKIPDIWDLFKYKILLLKGKTSRNKHLTLRSGDEWAEILDLYGKYAFDDFSYDVHFKISNNGSIDELCERAKKIFEIIRILSEKSCSYFIIKPDGLRHIKKIYSIIESFVNNCDEVCFYRIDNYSELIKKLYYKLFTIKELEFDKKFDYLIEALKSLYGDKAILIIMYKNTKNEEDCLQFINEIYKLKHEIRESIMNTDIRIMIKTNADEKLNDNIIFNNENYFVALSRLLSVVHCPEPNIEETITELGILFDDGVICNNNIIDIKELMNSRLL